MTYLWIATLSGTHPDNPLNLSACSRCGAVVPVAAQELHDQHHAKLEKLEKDANKPWDPRLTPGWSDGHL